MSTIGVLLIVKNEGKKLAKCLESVSSWVDQIVVVDSGSTDDTVDVAKKFTNDIYVHDQWPGFGKQRQIAQSYLETEWVFAIDADEVVSDELKKNIICTVKENKHAVYMVNRLSSAFGKEIRHSGWSPDWIVRLYPRQQASYNDDLVHEKVIVSETLTKGRLKGYLYHDTYENMHHYIAKTTGYIKAWSDQREGKRVGFFTALIHAFSCFIRMYVLKLGFLDGKHGFILAWLGTHSTFVKYIDLWLRQNIKEKE